MPRLFSGNITYYLEKTAEETGGAAKAAGSAGAQAAAKTTAGAAVSRKDQRRADAEARERRNKLLKPLESELETLEGKIAGYEQAQAALTAALSSPEVAADADKLRETSNAVAQISGALENSYSRWGELSDEIERVKAKLGIDE